MNVDTKTKVPLKFGGLETLCGLEVQKATEIVTLPIHVKLNWVHAHALRHVLTHSLTHSHSLSVML